MLTRPDSTTVDSLLYSPYALTAVLLSTPMNDPVELLLSHGADILTVDAEGMICLHHAAVHHNFRALSTCTLHFD